MAVEPRKKFVCVRCRATFAILPHAGRCASYDRHGAMFKCGGIVTTIRPEWPTGDGLTLGLQEIDHESE